MGRVGLEIKPPDKIQPYRLKNLEDFESPFYNRLFVVIQNGYFRAT